MEVDIGADDREYTESILSHFLDFIFTITSQYFFTSLISSLFIVLTSY